MAELPSSPRAGVPIGRAAFLGLFGIGVAGIAAAPSISRALNSVVPKGLVPSAGWRIYTVSSPMPRFDPAAYRLRITGLVEQPVTLSWDAIRKLPSEQQTRDFHCVTGWSVGKVRWAGIRSKTLLGLVRPAANAQFVSFVSTEALYVDQLTLQQFSLPDVMLAHTMDGAPLAREHGSPLRLVIPEMYGYKNVKLSLIHISEPRDRTRSRMPSSA